MTTLLSFIGKGDRKKGYRTANYQFSPDFSRNVPYFGLALQEYLKPDRLILAGTDSSMWDVFFSEQNLGDDELLLEMIDAVETASVTQAMLQRYDQHLSDKLGLPVTCLLIPHARNEQEQIEILQSLATTIPAGEQLVLDVTHGFRHLPMLALVAARYLSHVQAIPVTGIYYGALEMTVDNITPVLELGSLLRMLDWTEALAVYDKSGDYGVFGQLLKDDGMGENTAKQLKLAAFHELTGSAALAKQNLDTVFKDINAHQGPIGGLFAPALGSRIKWRNEQTPYQRETALAQEYLKHEDFLRAAIYMQEAVITRIAFENKLNHNSYTERENAAAIAKESREFRELSDIRNALAHGTRSDSGNDRFNTLDTIKDEPSLSTRLKDLFKKLRS